MSALNDFNARIIEVRGILDYVAPETTTLTEAARRPFSDGTLARSCLVLGVSYFEGYLKDAVDECLDTLVLNQVPCSRVGEHIKGYIIREHLEVLRLRNEPDQLWRAVTTLQRFNSSLAGDEPILDTLVPRNAIKRAMTSIEPSNVNELLRTFGETDLNRGPVSRHGEMLKSVKRVRDMAVHGNESDLPVLSIKEVDERLSDLSRCAADLAARLSDLIGVLDQAELNS